MSVWRKKNLGPHYCTSYSDLFFGHSKPLSFHYTSIPDVKVHLRSKLELGVADYVYTDSFLSPLYRGVWITDSLHHNRLITY